MIEINGQRQNGTISGESSTTNETFHFNILQKTGRRRPRPTQNVKSTMIGVTKQNLLTFILTTVVLHSTIFPKHIITCDAWTGTSSYRRRLGGKYSRSIPSITVLDPFFLATPAQYAASKLELRMHNRNSIRMLLDNPRFPSSLLASPTTTLAKRRPPTEDETQQSPPKKHGILGFDIFTCQVGRSNVNLETWNGGMGDIGYHAMSLAFNSTTQLPWIPTQAQIQSLKVTELKEACKDRGLVKMGNKADLQNRLWEWTTQEQQQHVEQDFVSEWFDTDEDGIVEDIEDGIVEDKGRTEDTKSPNSLAEWSRTVDLESFREKRREIHRQKKQGYTDKQKEEDRQRQHKSPGAFSSKEYLQKLQKTLETPSSQYSSNVQAKEIYVASKYADKAGDRETSIQLLQTLLTVTPNDGRVYRRLSRMYNEQGEKLKARSVLQMGLQKQPENPWLWHGMAQLLNNDGSEDSTTRIRKSYQKAIQLDPTFAHSYHALGTFEHTQGNIAQAMRILKQGVKYCPSNHRLHHALGDIYRGARLFEDAERAYHRALEHGSPINFSFAYSALAAVAFERDEMNAARKWLRRSVQLNNGRHAQGWVSLAQLEEAQGNMEDVRSTCAEAITQYEAWLIESGKRYRHKYHTKSKFMSPGSRRSFEAGEGAVGDFASLMQQTVPRYRSGDRFLKVYRNWARFEQKHGTPENVDAVFSRAFAAFPLAIDLILDWAKYHASCYNHDRARSLYMEACLVENRNQIKSYRAFAEFEMSLLNYEDAHKILLEAAEIIARSEDGGLSDWRGLAKLYLTWAICEWHNDNLPRAEVLFDHALRQTKEGQDGAGLRSFILYSMARFEFSRGRHILAQHCIGVCMKENAMPLGKSMVWKLWAEVASAMKNTKLQEECLHHAEVSMTQEDQEHHEHPLLGPVDSPSRSKQNLFRRDPWQIELFGFESTRKARSDFYSRVDFPPNMTTSAMEPKQR